MNDLKERKKALRLTTAELAYLADLPVGTVSKIMTGETKNPGYLTIEKIDLALKKEEMRKRIEAYIKAMDDYYLSHEDEERDPIKFEKMYNASMNTNKRVGATEDVPLTEGNTALQPYPKMTVSDLESLGEDRRFELINGHLIYSEYPSISHQRIVKALGKIIDDFITSHNGRCEVFNVGVNVKLDEDEYTFVGPDLAVVRNPEIIDPKAIIGAPDWIIEVTSPGTRKVDYSLKLGKYISAGVHEYWIVDPDKEIVTVYLEGEPTLATVYRFTDIIPVGIYDGALSLRINDLYQPIKE